MNPVLLALLVLLAPVAADPKPPSLRKDVIPEGAHRIKFRLTIDASAVSSCLCRAYLIAPGDTVTEIARRECGDVRCADEIRLINPQLKGDKLRAGDYLRIPPRVADPESRAESRNSDARSCWVILAVQWGRSGAGSPSAIVEGEPIEVWTREGLRVVAVPRDKLLWFLQLPFPTMEIAEPIDGVLSSNAVVPTWILPEDDPAITVEKRVTLKPSKDRGVTFDVDERRYDKKGKLLPETREPKSGSFARLPVAILGIGALLGVIAIGWSRRRRAEGAPVA